MVKFGFFLLLYSFTKLIRMMAAATVLMTAAFIVCQAGGSRTWRLNLGMLAVVPSACLMANSRIFFTGSFYLFTYWTQKIATEEMAVFYFSAAGLLAARYLYQNGRLRRKHLGMQPVEENDCPPFVRQGRGPKIKVYLTEECCSPYAGGIARPYIVVPKVLKNSLSKEEFAAVLYHETLHIRQGHVLLLTVFAWLKIIWWIHPMIYLLDRKLRENAEYSSDEGSVALGPLSTYAYAGIILKTIRINQQAGFLREGIPTFSGDSFAVIKKRMERLAAVRINSSTRREYQRKRQLSKAVTMAAVLAVAAAMAVTSLPRYTRLEEISAFDESLQPLTYDLKQEGFEAQVTDGMFHMSAQEMQRFAVKYGLRGEYVIFSYDTIMKVPGVGGFGQAARVRVSDASDVQLLGRMDWIDRVEAFILKYLV